MTRAKRTTDHEEIRRWVEARGGRPACVKGTGRNGDVGLLRIDYPEIGDDDALMPLDWETWFRAFDEGELAMLLQDRTSDGRLSRFSQLVSRDQTEPRPVADAEVPQPLVDPRNAAARAAEVSGRGHEHHEPGR